MIALVNMDPALIRRDREAALLMTFAELGLSPKVLEAVTSSGYTIPTPIQAQAIPQVLARKDVLGIAQTGTGKTAAFTLPMLTLLEQGRARARMPRTLILEPTRELAAQVEENFTKYGANQKLSVALLIGGVSFGDQDLKITRGVDVLIATPGRLLDHFERGKLLLTGIEILVIDEADRMLDMGFIPDIERICKLVPFTRQTLFFSATMPPEIQRLTEAFLHNPTRIEVERQSTTASTITQRLVASQPQDWAKRDVLRTLIRQEEIKNAIIFCNRKIDVANLHKSLSRHGFNVTALHGDMDQRARTMALDAFRAGTTQLLVASDVAARGLDIPEVSLVAILDADKEGFLRSERSLIQTIGRAARNLNGRAILYGDKMTDSMKRAIGETERRRNKQIAFNLANNITPIGIKKQIREMIDGVYKVDEARAELFAAQEQAKYEAMSEKQISKEIKRLEKLMQDHAKNLEFEKAAQVRDQLHVLKEQLFGAPGSDNVMSITGQ